MDNNLENRTLTAEQSAVGETTQLTSDDQLADGGAMPAERSGAATSWRKVEQDTVAVNPSPESMDSRG